MTRILAIDAATTSGWALGVHTPGVSAPDVLKFGTMTTAGKGGVFFALYAGWMNNLLADFKPDVLICEIPHIVRGNVEGPKLLGALAIVQLACYRRDIVFVPGYIPAMRTLFLGKGGNKLKRAQAKPRMIEAAKHRGHQVDTDDEADAVGYLYLASDKIQKGQVL